MVSTESAQILLVARRDPQDPVRRVLKDAGYAFVSVDSQSTVLKTAERSRPALIVLEPGAVTSPIAGALATHAETEHIRLVHKWASLDSLLAQIEQVLGKPTVEEREGRHLTVGPLSLDLTGRVAQVEGRHLDLTAREFELVCHMARHPGWVFSRQELLEQVWGYEFGDPRVVTVHVANLRKKLAAAYPDGELLQTVRGVGYKLVAPAVQSSPAEVAPQDGPEATDSTAATPRGTDERRLVTVLVGHVTGAAVLADVPGFESLSAAAAALYGRVVPCIERYGGTVQRLSADSALAVFGAPFAHDNDAEMAIRAAADVMSAVSDFKKENAISGLSLHMGLATGMAVLVPAGADSSPLPSVVGAPVDAASYLAGLAAPGEILMNAEALSLVQGLVDVDPAGQANIDGSGDGIAFSRLTAVHETREDRFGARAFGSELVGRDEQMALFRGAISRLEEGAGRIVFVVGEAGVGKSRLHCEMRDEAVAAGLKWIEARTLAYGRNMSYLPFRRLIQADCGIDAATTAEERARKLRSRVERLFADDADDFISVLAGLLGIGPEASGSGEAFQPYQDMKPGSFVDRMARYVKRLATERPIVMALEDVHWLDRSSIALIQTLFSLVLEVPVLICLIGRCSTGSPTMELLDFARRNHSDDCCEISLNLLSRRQTKQMVRNLLGGDEIESSIMRVIESQSEGNPFFVEEIIRHLADSGTLRKDERGRWVVLETAGELALPATVQGVIAARIDGLPDSTRQHLLQASVIGRSFYRRLLRTLSNASEAEFEADIRSLLEHQLIAIKTQEPEQEYLFKHALVQEVAYGRVLKKQRKLLHLRVARAIEELYAEQIKDLYGILAYHYTKAEDWRRAQVYLLEGGNQSISLAADSECVAQYQEAMAALLRAFDESWDSPDSSEQVTWFVAAAEPFWLARCLGDLLDSALVFYKKVLAACGPGDPRTMAATTVLGGCYYQRGLYDEAIELVEEGLTALERSGRHDDRSTTRLLLLSGMCLLNTLDYSRAEAVLERAFSIESEKSTPDQGLLQDLYLCLGTVYIVTGRRDDVRKLLGEALERFDMRGKQRYWLVLLNLSDVNLIDGRWEEAKALAQECLDGSSSPYVRAFALAWIAKVRLAEGAYLDAEERLRQAAAVFEELHEPTRRLEVLADLAETLLRAGKVEEAERTARKALAFFEATSSNVSQAEVFWTLSGTALAREDYADAESLLAESFQIVQAKYSPRDPLRAEIAFRLAELRLKQGRLQEGEEEFERAVSQLAEITSPEHPRIAQMKIQWAAINRGDQGRREDWIQA